MKEQKHSLIGRVAQFTDLKKIKQNVLQGQPVLNTMIVPLMLLSEDDLHLLLQQHVFPS